MSQLENYGEWRLTSNEGIKYRFLGLEGSFDYHTGDVNWRGIFRSQDLIPLCNELFPPPRNHGGLIYSINGTMPGWPNMTARRVSFKALDGGGQPCDALNTDPTAPVGTYHGYVEVTINFASGNNKNPDPTNPRTFLEISSSTGGEFIYAPPGNSLLADEENEQGSVDESPGTGPVNPESGEISGRVSETERRPNRSPVLPTTIIVPTTEWTIKWKHIPLDYFKNVCIHRLRYINGRVNSTACNFLYNAAPETLLCTGFTHAESYSWKDAQLETPPIDIEIKLVEKRIIRRGITIGHNHVWEPGVGWRRVWVGPNKDEPMYYGSDFNFLFKV